MMDQIEEQTMRVNAISNLHSWIVQDTAYLLLKLDVGINLVKARSHVSLQIFDVRFYIVCHDLDKAQGATKNTYSEPEVTVPKWAADLKETVGSKLGWGSAVGPAWTQLSPLGPLPILAP